MKPFLVIAITLVLAACDKGPVTKTSPSVAHTCAELTACCTKVAPEVKKQCVADTDKAHGNADDCAATYAAYCP